MHDFAGAPASVELATLVARSLEALTASEAARMALAAAPAAIRDSIPRVFAASDFVARSCARDAQLLAALVGSGDLERRLAPREFASRAPALAGAAS
jgi:glutamine synthetase adenylyltransferase